MKVAPPSDVGDASQAQAAPGGRPTPESQVQRFRLIIYGLTVIWLV
jgi:hypothetical protein